jgi:hypothetical protein
MARKNQTNTTKEKQTNEQANGSKGTDQQGHQGS